MFLSFAYLAFSAVLKLLLGRRRSEFAKDVELLVLRHQLVVLGRLFGAYLRYALYVFHARARIPDPPGRSQTRSIRPPSRPESVSADQPLISRRNRVCRGPSLMN
jgi:hypothetical protein